MLKVAVIVLIVMLAYAGIYSLMTIIAPNLMMGSTFKAATGKALDSQDPDFKVLLGGQRLAGVFALTTVISGFFVLFAGFRKAQKWAWWAFLVVAGIAWLWGLISSITIVDKMNMILYIIGTVIFLVGLLLPIKEFFVKGAEKTDSA